MKSTSLSFPIEAWAYILKLCQEKNVTVHGPFTINRKHLQMRSNLDLTAVRVTGEAYTVRSETRSQLRTFDEIVGKYACYGTSEPKPLLKLV